MMRLVFTDDLEDGCIEACRIRVDW